MDFLQQIQRLCALFLVFGFAFSAPAKACEVLFQRVTPELVNKLLPEWEKARAEWGRLRSLRETQGLDESSETLYQVLIEKRRMGSFILESHFEDLRGKHEKELSEEAWENARVLVDHWAETGERLNATRLQKINALILRGKNQGIRNAEAKRAGRYFLEGAKVESALNVFFTWYHFAEANNLYHPVVLASLAHQRLKTINPFHDGNARTIHLFVDYVLMSHGYPPVSFRGSLGYVANFEAQPNSVSADEALTRLTRAMEGTRAYARLIVKQSTRQNLP